MKKVLLFAALLSMCFSVAACGKKEPVEVETVPIEVDESDDETLAEGILNLGDDETEETKETEELPVIDANDGITYWADVLSFDEATGVAYAVPNGNLTGNTVFFHKVPVSAFLDFIDNEVFANSDSKMNRELFYQILSINVLNSDWTEGSMYLFEMAIAAETCMACDGDIVAVKDGSIHSNELTEDVMDHIEYTGVTEDGTEKTMLLITYNNGKIEREVNGVSYHTDSSETIVNGLFQTLFDLYGEDMEDEDTVSDAGDVTFEEDDEEDDDEYVDDSDDFEKEEPRKAEDILSEFYLIANAADMKAGDDNVRKAYEVKVNGKSYDLLSEDLYKNLVKDGWIEGEPDAYYASFAASEDSWSDVFTISATDYTFSSIASVSLDLYEVEKFECNGIKENATEEDIKKAFGEPTEVSEFGSSRFLDYEIDTDDYSSVKVEFSVYEDKLTSIYYTFDNNK